MALQIICDKDLVKNTLSIELDFIFGPPGCVRVYPFTQGKTEPYKIRENVF